MGCSTCGSMACGTPAGCGSNGSCATGGCNKKNTYDWLSNMDIHDPLAYDYVEVSFKNGSRKDYFKKIKNHGLTNGDMALVSCVGGYDVGQISLMGDLVRLQLKKRHLSEEAIDMEVIRRANSRDIEKLEEARAMEHRLLVRARVLSRTLKLDMKIGDVEFRGDKRKATFFYTAEGRVDFRELVKQFAGEFRIKIEMRQIGARQESSRIGGLGSCGRELCCSTWLSDFKSVSTSSARYQKLSINQTKLSGQCGRLKCCLNYELDTYMEALKTFPKKAETLYTEAGKATMVKMDILKGLMFYSYVDAPRANFIPITKERVAEIKELNDNDKKPEELVVAVKVEKNISFDDHLTGIIELPVEKRNHRRSKNRRNRPKNQSRDNRKNPSQPSGSGHRRTDRKNRNSNKNSNSNSNANKKSNKNPNKKSD